jgi:hypothetical protein
MIPRLDLDDVTYQDLTSEALASIPKLCPAWTDYNASDPGITLIELFAWLCEMLIFRVDQITDDNRWKYLWLLNGPAWVPPVPPDQPGALDAATRSTALALRTPSRAVTTADYEYLVARVFPAWAVARGFAQTEAEVTSQIGRVRCLGETDLATAGGGAPPPIARGHLSVVIIPSASSGSSSPWAPPAALLAQIGGFLEDKRLLTNFVHVVGPRVALLRVEAALFLYPNATGAAVKAAAIASLIALLHPLTGGPDGRGWPFQRNLYISDLYATLQAVPGVNFVSTDPLVAPVVQLWIAGAGSPVSEVDLTSYDVLWLTADQCLLQTWEPVGYPIGRQYVQTE